MSVCETRNMPAERYSEKFSSYLSKTSCSQIFFAFSGSLVDCVAGQHPQPGPKGVVKRKNKKNPLLLKKYLGIAPQQHERRLRPAPPRPRRQPPLHLPLHPRRGHLALLRRAVLPQGPPELGKDRAVHLHAEEEGALPDDAGYAKSIEQKNASLLTFKTQHFTWGEQPLFFWENTFLWRPHKQALQYWALSPLLGTSY